MMKALIKKNLPNFKVFKVTTYANLFIIGAQKCGTSTLFDNLIKHKNIHGGKVKEKNFFNHEHLFEKGIDWYHQLFPNVSFFIPSRTNYFLDASPSYLPSKEVAKKIYAYNPEAKFIIMMRNPIDRAFSAWNMYKQMNLLSLDEKENLIKNHIEGLNQNRKEKFINMINLESFPTFETMVEEELSDIVNNKEPYPGIIKRGIYYEQIANYLTLFNPQQFFYICSEEFKERKFDTLKKLFFFLELNPNLPEEKLKDQHKREYQNKMSSEIREKLKEFYQPHNQKLYALINKNYNWE